MTIEILTALLVLITGFYAWATYRMLGVMAEQAEATTRPYISISTFLEPDNPIFYLRISNTGKTSASNLRLSIDRSFWKFGESTSRSDISTFGVFNQPIDSFAPGSEIVVSLAQGFVIFAENADQTKVPQCFAVTASYGYGKRTVTEVSNIDLRPYRNANVPQDATIRKLGEISDTLKALADKLGRS